MIQHTPLWYGFTCGSGTELEAQRILTSHGAIGRNPVEYRYARTRKDGTKVVVPVPRLRGYYFGLWMFDPNWRVISELRHRTGTRVLRKALSRDGFIRPLDPVTVLQVQTLLCSDADDRPDIEMQHGLKPGDTVIVKGGKHDGFRCRLERRKKDNTKGQTFTALLEILGGMREVEVAAENCELVEAAA